MEKSKIKDENLSYSARIENEKEKFKEEVLKYNSKNEKLLYLKQQKQRYSLLKENSKFTYGIGIIISFAVLIAIIFILGKVENNIFITSLVFTLVVMNICISIILMTNLKNISSNYLITVFALQELEDRVNGTISGSDSEMAQLKEVMKNMSTEIQKTKDEVKEGYAMVDLKISELKDKLY